MNGGSTKSLTQHITQVMTISFPFQRTCLAWGPWLSNPPPSFWCPLKSTALRDTHRKTFESGVCQMAKKIVSVPMLFLTIKRAILQTRLSWATVVWMVKASIYQQYFVVGSKFKKSTTGVAQPKPTDRAMHFAPEKPIVRHISSCPLIESYQLVWRSAWALKDKILYQIYFHWHWRSSMLEKMQKYSHTANSKKGSATIVDAKNCRSKWL